MIKELVSELVHDLNNLDQDSDTVLYIDWSTRNIVLTQISGKIIMCNRLWVLINSSRDKGHSTEVISSSKLVAIKSYLIKYLNSSNECILVPEAYGFRLIMYTEVLFRNANTRLWTNYGEISFKFSRFAKLILRLTNKSYQSLVEPLKEIKFS